MCQTKTRDGKKQPGVLDFCGMGHGMFSDTFPLRWLKTVSNTFDGSLFLNFNLQSFKKSLRGLQPKNLRSL